MTKHVQLTLPIGDTTKPLFQDEEVIVLSLAILLLQIASVEVGNEHEKEDENDLRS